MPLPLINTNCTIEKSMQNANQMTHQVKSLLEKPSLSTNFNQLLVRYGSAANIPHQDSFDLKSILSSKPVMSSNDLMNSVKNSELQQLSVYTNNINELLIDYTRDRENLIRIARKTQEDFISAMNLD